MTIFLKETISSFVYSSRNNFYPYFILILYIQIDSMCVCVYLRTHPSSRHISKNPFLTNDITPFTLFCTRMLPYVPGTVLTTLHMLIHLIPQTSWHRHYFWVYWLQWDLIPHSYKQCLFRNVCECVLDITPYHQYLIWKWMLMIWNVDF